jgi:hypothetical protein
MQEATLRNVLPQRRLMSQKRTWKTPQLWQERTRPLQKEKQRSTSCCCQQIQEQKKKEMGQPNMCHPFLLNSNFCAPSNEKAVLKQLQCEASSASVAALQEALPDKDAELVHVKMESMEFSARLEEVKTEPDAGKAGCSKVAQQPLLH